MENKQVKIKKSRLRKIINEELTRALFDSNIKNFVDLRERILSEALSLEGHGEEGRMAKKQLQNIINDSESIMRVINDATDLEPWVAAKLTKASDYLDGVSRHLSHEQLEEEVMPPSGYPTASGETGEYDPAAIGIADPHAQEAGEDEWFNNLQIASRIIEDLPLDKLPIQITDAAQSLRDGCDLMISKLDEADKEKI